MERVVISKWKKTKPAVDANGQRCKAELAQVVYKTPVGKGKNGETKYASRTRHEIVGYIYDDKKDRNENSKHKVVKLKHN